MEPKGPEPLGEILGRLFAARGWGRRQDRLRLETAWAEVEQPAWKGRTRVGALKRGVLEIEVRDSILMQELSQFHKRKLLKELRPKLEGVPLTDLRFRAGTW